MRKLLVSLVLIAAAAAGWFAWRGVPHASAMQMQLARTGVKAPPEQVFAVIEDFRKWADWSPHERADPAVKRTFSGAAAGTGAVYEWRGGSGVGAGRAQITDSAAPTRLVVAVDLAEPVAGHLSLTFTLTKADDGTHVAVATSGPSDLVTAVMRMFFGGDLIRLSCASEESPEPICGVFMKDFVPPRS
jgi:uncharacterized protein YndB with AHSA1/START domain